MCINLHDHIQINEIEHFEDLVIKVTRDYYDATGAHYSLATAPTGQQWALLSRRGLLDVSVFDIRATPDHAYTVSRPTIKTRGPLPCSFLILLPQQWNQILIMFKLRDPLTGRPFPTPIPRGCFPTRPDYLLHPASARWSQQALADARAAHAFPCRSLE